MLAELMSFRTVATLIAAWAFMYIAIPLSLLIYVWLMVKP